MSLRFGKTRRFIDDDRLKLTRFHAAQNVHHSSVQPDVHVHVRFGRLFRSLDGCQLSFKLCDCGELSTFPRVCDVLMDPTFGQGAVQRLPVVAVFLKSGLRSLQHVGGVLLRHAEAIAKKIDDVLVWMTIHQGQVDGSAARLGFSAADAGAWGLARDVSRFVFVGVDVGQVDVGFGLRLPSARHLKQPSCSGLTGQASRDTLNASEH